MKKPNKNDRTNMTDEQANTMVRAKLNRAQNGYRANLKAYYTQTCKYIHSHCTIPCDKCRNSQIEMAFITIDDDIKLCFQEHEIRIIDKTGIKVYKMNNETWYLARDTYYAHNKKLLLRQMRRKELSERIIHLVIILGTVCAFTQFILLLGEESTQHPKQENAIQKQIDDCVDSVNVAKTAYYYDNINSIRR